MNLIQSTSCLNCKNSSDEERHIKESNRIYDALLLYENNLCSILIEKVPNMDKSLKINPEDNIYFKDIDNLLDIHFDYRNGTDYYINDSGDLAIKCYGKIYYNTKNKKYAYKESVAHISIYDNFNRKIDISKILLNLKIVFENFHETSELIENAELEI